MVLKKTDINLFLYCHCLLLPIIFRWIFLNSLESLFTINFLEYPLFIPELLFFFLPFLWKPKYGRNNKLVIGGFIGLIYLMLNCIINEIPTLYLNFISGTDFFICFIIIGLFPLSFNQINYFKWTFFIVFIFICLQVLLISTGIISYTGENNSTDDAYNIGELIRFKTTVGSSIQTGLIITFLVSILCYGFKSRFINFFIVLFGLICVAMTLSRGPLLLYLILLLYLGKDLLLFIYKKIIHLPIILLFFGLCFFGIFMVDSQIGITKSLGARFEGRQEDLSSGRDIRYIYAIDIFKNNVLFGAGSGNTKPYNRTGENIITSPSYNQYRLSPHNTYLLYLADYGIFGFLIFIYLFFNILKIAFIKKKLNAINLTLLFILLISMNTEVIYTNMDMLLIILIMAFLSGSINKMNLNEK